MANKDWPRGDSAMAERIRAYNWAATPLGPTDLWPPSLIIATGLLVNSRHPIFIWWGPEHIQIYNDAYSETMGPETHPFALGRSGRETWAEIWDVIGPQIEQVMSGGPATWHEDQLVPVTRHGGLKAVWWTYSFSPIEDDAAPNGVGGVMVICRDVTNEHQAREAVAESEARHRLLIESWTQAVWETDPNGVVVADSPSWRAYTGQTLNEWLGYGWLNAIHPDDRAYAERQWREAIAGRGLVDADFRLRAPDGGWRWTNVRAASILNAEGSIEKWVGMNIDVDARKRAEASVRESEEKYRSLFEAMVEGFYYAEAIFDERGRCVDLFYLDENPAAIRMIGQSAKGRLMSELAPYEQHWRDIFGQTARTGQPQRLEQFAGPDGIWFDFFVFKPAHASGDQFAVVFNDVTERRRAEEAVRESEERQAYFLALSDALRPLADQEEIQAEAMRLLGEKIGVNRAQYYIADETGQYLSSSGGYSNGIPAAIGRFRLIEFGKYAYDGFHAGETQVVSDATTDPRISADVLRSYETVGFLAYIGVPFVQRGRLVGTVAVHQSGPRQWTESERMMVEETAERAGIAVEQARAEKSFRESEARFRQFADASAAGMWIRDAKTLAMEYVSPAIATIYGVEPDAFIGDMKRWAATILPEDRDVAFAHIDQARKGDAVVHEFRIQRPDDQTFRWIRNTDFPLLDQHGQVERIGGLAEDVTEAKLATEHTSVLLAELQHRVRNIMAIMRSIVSRTAERAESVEEYQTLMMGRLLAFARVQALLTRAANVSVGLRGVVEDEIGVQAHYEGQYAVDGPDVALSPKAAEILTLAIHELATNALKYGALSVPDGKVTVRWSILEKRGSDWLSLDWTEEGAPERQAPSPDKPRRRGFGSELIEARIPYELKGRGQVTIEAGGAQCHLEFPLKHGASVLETGAPQRASVFGGALDMTGQANLTGHRVLVVEDDYYLATDAARALQGAGAEVMGPCPTEEDARAELSDQRPDAVILDINLGHGATFKLAELLKDSGIPFVFVTGYDQSVIPAEFDAVERVEKPVQLRQVVAAVSRIVTPAESGRRAHTFDTI